MQLFDHALGEGGGRMVNDIVDATEMVGRFNDVVNPYSAFGGSDSVCLIDIAGLFLSQAAALDMVRVVRKVDLGPVVNASLDFRLFLPAQGFKKGRGSVGTFLPLWQCRVGRYAPSLSDKLGFTDFSLYAIVAYCTFCKPMSRCIFFD